MENKIIEFGDIEIRKQNFHQHKRPIPIKIQMLIKQQYLIRSLLTKRVFKFFDDCKDDKKMRPLFIFLPKMRACRRDFDETKVFLIKDYEM